MYIYHFIIYMVYSGTCVLDTLVPAKSAQIIKVS